MLPARHSDTDRFRMAVDAGFSGIEMQTVEDRARAEMIRDAAERAGLRIHSVLNKANGGDSLSSVDPGTVRRVVEGLQTALRTAKLWGADAVRLGPAVIGPETSYADAWSRSQEVLRERVLPLAEDLEVVVAVEEVWNRFLLGPNELARYVDELASPWAKASVNLGNVLFYAYPQDWIRTLGPRVATVHLKDFRLDGERGRPRWKNLGEGDVDWAEVRKALAGIGYEGWVTAELAAGDAAYLRDVASRVDRLLG
jgi:hexulose-6-phosphate isomerase